MSTHTIPGATTEYHMIAFDADGRERTDDVAGGVFSRTVLERVKADSPTNIFFFSHGWQGDAPAAIAQYNRWIKAMVDLTTDAQRMGAGFKPMWIGLHWPSLPWGEEGSGSFAVAGGRPLDELFEETVRAFGGSAAIRGSLKVIFDAHAQDPGASDVPEHALQAYRDLAGAIGFSAGKGTAGAPDEEGEALDPQAALEADTIAMQSFGPLGAIGGGILSGLGQLSFWMMKKRGRAVGEGGMHQFVSALQQVSNAKIHLIGHSFGCVVVSSILNGPQGTGALARPINSVALVQGAMSLWSYADQVLGSSQPGYFRSVLTRGVVGGPIITTKSRHDTAVGILYPAAVGLVREADFADTLPKYGGIGSFGIQGTSIAVECDMLDKDGDYSFASGKIYNLESSKYIAKKEGVSGAHSDIAGPQVAHAIWQAALAS
jgi:hypothetical protein